MLIQTNQTYEYRGMEMAYHETGQGKAMIMLHNGGCNHIIWKNQIEEFSGNHRVIAFDLIGFGDSARPRVPFTLDLYVDALAQFIEDEGIEKPILMGNCIGAAICLEYSLQHPEKVHAQILCNICGGASMMQYFHPYMFTPQGNTFDEKLYAFMFLISKFAFVRKKVVRRLYGGKPEYQNEIFQRILNGISHPMQAQSRIMLIKGLYSFNKFDHFEQEEPALPRTMVFWGEKNQVLPLKRGKRLIEKLQPERSYFYPTAGHLLMAEEPRRFNQEVSEFIYA
ncbi:MAG: alpha/beta hydrolase [Bacteroidota bacterium]